MLSGPGRHPTTAKGGSNSNFVATVQGYAGHEKKYLPRLPMPVHVIGGGTASEQLKPMPGWTPY